MVYSKTYRKDNISEFGVKTTSVQVREDLKNIAQQNGIPFRKALEFGINFLRAQMDDMWYPPNLLSNKLKSTQEKLEEFTNKYFQKETECKYLQKEIERLKEENNSKDQEIKHLRKKNEN